MNERAMTQNFALTPVETLLMEFGCLKERNASDSELAAWRKSVKERYGLYSSRLLEQARLMALGGGYRCSNQVHL